MNFDTPYIAGVIGAGSFGLTIANLLAENGKVLLFVRNDEKFASAQNQQKINTIALSENITVTQNAETLSKACQLIFPVVPSSSFKEMLQTFAPYLTPYHILIHGTKGLHIEGEHTPESKLERTKVLTMSELILQNTPVVRVGCLAGPNLAKELLDHQPAGTVIASRFNQVIKQGKLAISSNRFKVYGSNDLMGIELAGVLKNYMAIASGMVSAMGYGENTKALLITQGVAELIAIAKTFGQSEKPFLGLAGMGDLMATCNSKLSRNFRMGYYLANGKSLEEAAQEVGEVAEGVKTLQVVMALKHYGFSCPIADTIYRIIFKGLNPKVAIEGIMRFPVANDADYV